MRRILSAAIVTFIGAVPFDALACSCEPPPPAPEALRGSVAVFSGTVTEIEEWETARDGLFYKVTLVVRESWAGASEEEISVVTATDCGRCGYGFMVGGDYLVYAHGYRSEAERLPQTGLCTRTRALAEAQDDIVALRRPTAVSPTPWGRVKAP